MMAATSSTPSTHRASHCEQDTTTQITINRAERDELRDHLSVIAERGLDEVSRIAVSSDEERGEDWLERMRRDISWAFAVLDELRGDAESYGLTLRPELVALVEREAEHDSLRAKLHGVSVDAFPKVELSALERQVLREVAAEYVTAHADDLKRVARRELASDQVDARSLEGALGLLDALGWQRDGDEARQRYLRGTPPVIRILREEHDGTDSDIAEAACRVILERFGERSW